MCPRVRIRLLELDGLVASLVVDVEVGVGAVLAAAHRPVDDEEGQLAAPGVVEDAADVCILRGVPGCRIRRLATAVAMLAFAALQASGAGKKVHPQQSGLEQHPGR
jgi:hypothetical protein